MPLSFSETEDGEQVDVDGVAVEDVDTGQDVLNKNTSTSALTMIDQRRANFTYEEACSVASVLLVVGGALPAVLPLAAVVLALDGSSSTSLQLCGGSSSGGGNGGGNEEDLGELHVC